MQISADSAQSVWQTSIVRAWTRRVPEHTASVACTLVLDRYRPLVCAERFTPMVRSAGPPPAAAYGRLWCVVVRSVCTRKHAVPREAN